jgi:hypothetical protein
MGMIRIDLSGIALATVGVQGWALRASAAAHLRRIRADGLNRMPNVAIHPAHNQFFRFHVIARPDALSEMTLLMGMDGTWARGRLFDAQPGGDHIGAPWVSMPGPQRIPAHRTHDYTVCELRRDPRLQVARGTLSARCVACHWTYSGTDAADVRSRGVAHRDELTPPYE